MMKVVAETLSPYDELIQSSKMITSALSDLMVVIKPMFLRWCLSMYQAPRPLDGILLGFLNSRREMPTEGASVDAVIGSENVSV